MPEYGVSLTRFFTYKITEKKKVRENTYSGIFYALLNNLFNSFMTEAVII